MPTRPEVQRWQLGTLTEWAGELERSAERYEGELTRMLTHFSDVTWTGKAKDAASDRFVEEHDQGRKLTIEVLDVAAFLRAADARLSNERQALLNRVTDAETDSVALLVTDDWAVLAAANVGDLDDEQRRLVDERIEHHRGLIESAVRSLEAAADDATKAITTGSQEIRVRGDQLGSGVEAAVGDYSEAGRIGAEDGRAVAEAVRPNGTIDQAALDRIAGQLPQGVLTDAERQVLAEGGEVSTLPASVQDYYREFYQAAGKDGVLALNEQLRKQEEAGNQLAATRRDTLANGLLVVSNEKIGTGRNPDGSLRSPGGYDKLPDSVRDLVETRFPVSDNDSAEPRPHSGRPARMPEEGLRLGEIAEFSDLLSQSNPGYQPGTELGTEMIEQSAYLVSEAGDDLKTVPYLGDPGSQYESTAAKLLDVAGRNEESAYRILTGDGMPEDYDPQKVAGAVLGNDWSDVDNGRSAAQMLDWIGPDSHSTDEVQADRARAALVELPNILAPEEDGVLTEDYRQYNENFAKNPELATALSQALQSNLNAVGDINNPNGYDSSEVVAQPGLGDRATLAASDADRLLMLANASEEGRAGLQAAINLNQQEMVSKAAENPDLNARLGPYLGTLAGRVDGAMNNAVLFQMDQDALERNEHLQSSYDAKRQGAEIAAELVQEVLPVKRGGALGEATGQVIVGQAAEALIDSVLQKPDLQSVEVNGWEDLRNSEERYLKDQILGAGALGEPALPLELLQADGTPKPWGAMTTEQQDAATGVMNRMGTQELRDEYAVAYGLQGTKFFDTRAELESFVDGHWTPEGK
ncbi:TPR repeat region-containing protein [Nocardia jiangsuensis]|uniref:TPR repeat domain-containing protein n=1 Tax=Nocardia jiangsuensis TaxID=1691563 RepID=A0ABV8DNP7_9NOCA